jgi:hypothetical protein
VRFAQCADGRKCGDEDEKSRLRESAHGRPQCWEEVVSKPVAEVARLQNSAEF